jgi:hypothetical protein
MNAFVFVCSLFRACLGVILLMNLWFGFLARERGLAEKIYESELVSSIENKLFICQTK